MATPGFYGGNALIAYPFVAAPRPMMTFPAGDSPLPAGTIVEFAARIAPEAEFRASSHRVRLAAISRDAGVLSFDFTCDAPSLAAARLRFRVSESDGPWTTVAATSTRGDDSAARAGDCGGRPLWDGLLVVGGLADLLGLLADGEQATAGPYVEPTRVKGLAASLAAVSVGNMGRTMWTPPGEPTPVREIRVVARCLAGDVRLLPGRNATLRQEGVTRTIAVDAAVGTGEGPPCGEIPTHPGELPVPGSPFLSGGPSCRDAITSISGVEGRAIRVIAGPGVTVGADPTDPHGIVVDVASPTAVGCGGSTTDG